MAMDAPPPATHLPSAGPGKVIGAMLVDLLLAAAVMIAMSLVAGTIWGAWRGLQVGMELAGQGKAIEAADVMKQIGRPGGVAMLWMSLVSTAPAALVPYWWRRRATPVEKRRSKAAALRPSTWGWTLATAAFVFLASSTITALGKHFGIAPEPTNQAPIIEAMTSAPLFAILFVLLLAPAYEELLFRRVLFGRLWAAGWPWLGMVLSGIAFALLHEVPGLSANPLPATLMLWLVYAVMGMAFAWVYRRTETLWAAFVAHMLNNAVALAVLQLSGHGM
ncbi:CPBP family intramembrane glutamic endopeptidase [Pseudoxanthomonas kalamensis]|uniref:CPBP family intramembrane glutamic endopeptidase n=1 Tax=Pseudoxanthomonas kalamensis TaxID=289483 RepID=UPI003CCD3CA5